ncbi:hypothetical protein ON010_g5968 [Phytophthora cinnamomi]|nr:hypothetical protein ON010_g5968 [Phytophthora cinnamomi]
MLSSRYGDRCRDVVLAWGQDLRAVPVVGIRAAVQEVDGHVTRVLEGHLAHQLDQAGHRQRWVQHLHRLFSPELIMSTPAFTGHFSCGEKRRVVAGTCQEDQDSWVLRRMLEATPGLVRQLKAPTSLRAEKPALEKAARQFSQLQAKQGKLRLLLERVFDVEHPVVFTSAGSSTASSTEPTQRHYKLLTRQSQNPDVMKLRVGRRSIMSKLSRARWWSCCCCCCKNRDTEWVKKREKYLKKKREKQGLSLGAESAAALPGIAVIIESEYGSTVEPLLEAESPSALLEARYARIKGARTWDYPEEDAFGMMEDGDVHIQDAPSFANPGVNVLLMVEDDGTRNQDALRFANPGVNACSWWRAATHTKQAEPGRKTTSSSTLQEENKRQKEQVEAEDVSSFNTAENEI